ncbi:MAG: hypothetical protein A3G49_01120 [Candidatus Sungbacteria bacterium RIFCSPLOWO2_12_FULL_41_11]|uniref:Phosphatidic acid phosphatase type 2/haloperoxidase domain-containing protein n=1 Tax=Candidatus Sungbacteria bacterium RIFCSPLOWO2_12_FULL_41_11 TaxID=1802286 RepID=A0A1G2LPC2_9BACT|nr:MAG: Bacitracin transport permease protein BCRC [Parcubacteria group bacterium GW2011_GWA2_42_14]OGZ97423.1 MAG: hypothetical protein A3D41_05670 [Candidatus Sungbacteria bacterium RIFCSPHIGHO2_02_FULL_41_12b]OHA13423.1 MAG: hypothetical protein A3G49_01120 [Candidatus Sungbacteria bacterium RIFCSPLOWO2_12_FULL_41_11]
MDILFKIDTQILLWFNSWVGWYDWVDITIVFRVEILPYFFIAGLMFFAVFYKNEEQKIKNRLIILEALAAGLISRYVITETIRFLYNRPRPFEAVEGLNQLLQHLPGYSFPSGHATFYFALAATIFLYHKKAGILFLFAAFQLTLTRIAIGFHWPSDILAGAILGITISLVVHYLEKYTPYGFKKIFIDILKKY